MTPESQISKSDRTEILEWSSSQIISRRKSIRLKGYDYSTEGAYFVTVCTYNWHYLFGEVVEGEMIVNDAGQMIVDIWHQIPNYYPGNDIDEFIIMPNHIHGIIFVGAGPRACPENGQPPVVAPTNLSLPDIVHRFKSLTTKKYSDAVKQKVWQPFEGKLWQRNYYDHVIRNDTDMNRIREYIVNNPAKWETDDEFRGGPL